MEIGNRHVKFQIDCYGSFNIVTKAHIDNWNYTDIQTPVWNKTEITPLGVTRIVIRNLENRKTEVFSRVRGCTRKI